MMMIYIINMRTILIYINNLNVHVVIRGKEEFAFLLLLYYSSS